MPNSSTVTNSQQTVVSAANNWNAANPTRPQIDPNILLGIMMQESGGNPNAINYNSNGSVDYGLMQLNTGSFPNAASLSPGDNVTTGTAYFGQLMNTFNGNTYQAIAAYNSGAGSVMKNGITNPKYVDGVLQKAGGDYSGGTIYDGTNSGGNPSWATQPVTGMAAQPLNNNTQNVDLNALVPQIVIQEGLDNTPWYDDYGLITGNPRLRAEVQPVSFQVILHDNKSFLLSSKGETGNPIQIQLNASMKSVNWSMKHIYHHQRTRTAHHITMWGMQADLIEGQCTTGVFMNQFGLTDYYSTRTINDGLKKLITSGQAFDDVMNNAAKGNPFFTQTDAFRVAAQDAFMEFLALFKMNGSVWFWNNVYTDDLGNSRDWTGIQAWSPTLGMSSAQKNGRNNDVLTRGGVLMSYRNFVYQGYFKTLQWTIDARNPFKWDFSFTFQVEKTVGQQFIPDR
jgi:hypothetical protein